MQITSTADLGELNDSAEMHGSAAYDVIVVGVTYVDDQQIIDFVCVELDCECATVTGRYGHAALVRALSF